MATLNLYKTYSFKNKDPIIDKIRTIIQDEEVTYKDTSLKSGVSITTLYGWFNGKTRRPQHASTMAVIRSLGYDYKLVRMK